MTKGLLIITLVLIILMFMCPIVITAIISKNSKEKNLFNKIMISTFISGILILIILLSFWITPLKSGDLTIKESTSKGSVNESVSLEEAGFNEVTLEQYLNLVKSLDKNIILVARPTCGYCEKFAPILKQAKDDLGLNVNYINTDNFSSDDWTKFTDSLDYLSSEEWGTPLLLIVQNGDIVAVNNGYVELDTIKSFFKENGFGE